MLLSLAGIEKMRPDFFVSVHEPTDVASARRVALQAASRAGFDEGEAGGVALIVTEAASNQIKHGGGGEIILRDLSVGSRPFMEIIAIDSGPGMNNVARCFADGYTTAGSQGTGLGAIARISSFHDVYSKDGNGTVLLAHAGGQNLEAGFEIGAINAPYPGETICGDAWNFHLSADGIRIIVADGLGHGTFAAQASAAAVAGLDDPHAKGPADVIESAHLRMKATRGAAVAVLDVSKPRRMATFSGVGNIAGAVMYENGVRRQMVSMNGTLGHEMRGTRQFEYPWPADSLIVLHSDGIGTHWSLDKYPGLIHRHPSVIAGVLFRDFRRLRDDATVVVLRARP